ncbi:MAG: OsmC family protein [Gammaproteobacteria bacterium]|nr:OsmC family protein [Gammaproteobacteria bacterium]
MNENAITLVKQRQEPLRSRYRETPDQAQISDHARASNLGSDPFHGSVVAGDSRLSLDFGIHRAVGGDHDLPNPGDVLCGALAACLDATLRMIAANMGLTLKTLEVEVRAFADVRGCLMVDPRVPAGFQRIDVDARVEAEDSTDPTQISKLTSAAEQCCVVLQTLRSDLPVETRFSNSTANASTDQCRTDTSRR